MEHGGNDQTQSNELSPTSSNNLPNNGPSLVNQFSFSAFDDLENSRQTSHQQQEENECEDEEDQKSNEKNDEIEMNKQVEKLKLIVINNVQRKEHSSDVWREVLRKELGRSEAYEMNSRIVNESLEKIFVMEDSMIDEDGDIFGEDQEDIYFMDRGSSNESIELEWRMVND